MKKIVASLTIAFITILSGLGTHLTAYSTGQEVRPPIIQMEFDEDILYTSKDEIILRGNISRGDYAVEVVLFNDAPLEFDRQGNFEITYALTQTIHSFDLIAIDVENNFSERSFMVVRDTLLPDIILTRPRKGALIGVSTPTLHFEVINELSPVMEVSVSVNDIVQKTWSRHTSNNYQTPLELTHGINRIHIQAKDAADNRAELIFEYRRGVFRRILLHIDKKKAELALDGEKKELEMDVPAFLHQNSTVVPLRFIAEAFGAQISWDPDEQEINIMLDHEKIVLWIDRAYAIVFYQKNDQSFSQGLSMHIKPFIFQGRTMVPVRFIAEAFGASVGYNAADRSIEIEIVTLS